MYIELKKQFQAKLSKLMEDNEIFWAFNKEQLNEGVKKFNISKDNKMVSIGMGGYMPSKNLKSYLQATKELEAWYKAEHKKLKKDKQALEEAILYELNNHECFYTGDIQYACDVLPDVSREEVKRVYNKYV